MKNWIFVSFMLVLAGVSSAQKAIPDGYTTLFHNSGAKASEGMIVNGKPSGVCKSYYAQGALKSEGKWKAGVLDSVWVFFAQTGDTIESISYRKGSKSGFHSKYYLANDSVKLNTVMSTELYVENVRQGKAYYYYPDGTVKESVNYVGGERHGESFLYNTMGSVTTIVTYNRGIIISKESVNRKDVAGNKVGVWKDFNRVTNKVIKEANYVGGKLDGYVKVFDNNGLVQESVLYRNDVEYSRSTAQVNFNEPIEEYFANGSIKSVGVFTNEKRVGLHRFYNESGIITNAVMYSQVGEKLAEGKMNDKLKEDGEWIFYDNTGIKTAIGSFANGKRTGKWNFYLTNGKIVQKGEFKEDKFTGIWIWYYETGEVWREEEYLKGKAEGIIVEFNKFGEKIVSGQHEEGERVGEWTIKVGDYTEIGVYAGGLKKGVWKSYYNNGVLYREGKYVQGDETGKFKVYHPNGKLWREEYYSAGRRVKNWREFSVNGDLVVTLSYQNDNLVKINGKGI